MWKIPRDNFVLKPHHSVCELHFEEHMVLKGKRLKLSDGTTYSYAYKTARLAPNAVPSLFPGPKYLSKRIPPPRRTINRVNREASTAKQSKPKEDEGIRVEEPTTVQEEEVVQVRSPSPNPPLLLSYQLSRATQTSSAATEDLTKLRLTIKRLESK